MSKLFVRVRHEQAIRVKGYAERDVVSDVGKFSCTLAARGTSLREADAKLHQHKQAVLADLKQAGFRDAEVTLDTVRPGHVGDETRGAGQGD